MPTIKMKRVLTTPALVTFGLAYMVPLGIFTTYGQVTTITHGHLPVAYIITLAMIIFTALSYCRMTTILPLSGSTYSYVQNSFGGNLGFLVGWAQILDYLFLPILNYIVLGIYLHEAFDFIPAYVFILASLISVSLLNYLGIKLINSVNFTLVIVQLIFIVLFIVLAFSSTAITVDTLLKPLMFQQDNVSGLFSGAAILCLAFLGFDAIATLAEESNDPTRTLPQAILWTVAIAGCMFLMVSYSAHLAYPLWETLIDKQDTASLIVVEHIGELSKLGGKFLSIFFLSAYLTGVFASAMTAQTSVSRIFYAMGRENVLPRKIFSKIHHKYHTPYLSIVFVGCFSLLSLVLPLDLVIAMISFGALGAFTFVNLCVIKAFVIDRKQRHLRALFKYGLLPLIGILLSLWLWTSLDTFALTIGTIWLGLGFIYLLMLTRGFAIKLHPISYDELKSIID